MCRTKPSNARGSYGSLYRRTARIASALLVASISMCLRGAATLAPPTV